MKGPVLALTLSATFILTVSGVLPFPTITVQWPDVLQEDSTQYVPSFSSPLEREFVLVYFGSAACRWCDHPALPQVIDSAKVIVREHATTYGASFSAMGIAIDWDTEDGVEHLDKVGRFDDIATGRIRYGLGAHTYRYLLEGTPQVSVLERTVPKSDEGHYERFEEKELIRYTSLAAIASWVRRGAPIPVGDY